MHRFPTRMMPNTRAVAVLPRTEPNITYSRYINVTDARAFRMVPSRWTYTACSKRNSPAQKPDGKCRDFKHRSLDGERVR